MWNIFASIYTNSVAVEIVTHKKHIKRNYIHNNSVNVLTILICFCCCVKARETRIDTIFAYFCEHTAERI